MHLVRAKRGCNVAAMLDSMLLGYYSTSIALTLYNNNAIIISGCNRCSVPRGSILMLHQMSYL